MDGFWLGARGWVSVGALGSVPLTEAAGRVAANCSSAPALSLERNTSLSQGTFIAIPAKTSDQGMATTKQKAGVCFPAFLFKGTAAMPCCQETTYPDKQGKTKVLPHGCLAPRSIGVSGFFVAMRRYPNRQDKRSYISLSGLVYLACPRYGSKQRGQMAVWFCLDPRSKMPRHQDRLGRNEGEQTQTFVWTNASLVV